MNIIGRKISQNFSKGKKFYCQSNKWLKIMFCLMSAVALVGVKIWFVHLKALEIRMRKLVLDLSLAQILSEEISKMLLPKKLGFIDVLQTVPLAFGQKRLWHRRATDGTFVLLFLKHLWSFWMTIVFLLAVKNGEEKGQKKWIQLLSHHAFCAKTVFRRFYSIYFF